MNKVTKHQKNSRELKEASADFIQQVSTIGSNSLKWEVGDSSTGYFDVDLTSLSDGDALAGILGRPELANEIATHFRPWCHGKAKSTVKRQVKSLKVFFRFLTDHQNNFGEDIRNSLQLNSVHGEAFKGWVLLNVDANLYEKRHNILRVEKWLNMARAIHQSGDLLWPTIEPGRTIQAHQDVDPRAIKAVYTVSKRVKDDNSAKQIEGLEVISSGRKAGIVNDRSAVSLYCRSRIQKRVSEGVDIAPEDARMLSSFVNKRFYKSLEHFYRQHVPLAKDSLASYMLVTMHTGWLDTTREICVVDDVFNEYEGWYVDRTPNTTGGGSNRLGSVIILSQDHSSADEDEFKDAEDVMAQISVQRPKTGRLVSALSNKKSLYHPFRVIKAQIERTRFLRELLRQIRSEILSIPNGSITQKRSLFEVERKLRSPWIFWNPKGLGHKAVGIIDGADPVAAQFKRHMVPEVCKHLVRKQDHDLIASIKALVPSDIRDGFASFLYDSSGGNIFVVQHGLGHASASTARHYLRQKRQIRENFSVYRKMCQTVFSEVRENRQVDPTIISLASSPLGVGNRDRELLREIRSRYGNGCAGPINPPENIAPNHISGSLCASQRCILCSHARLTTDAILPLARRLAELKSLARVIPAHRFITSSFELERQAIEIVREETYAKYKEMFDNELKLHTQALLNGTEKVFDDMPLGTIPAMIEIDKSGGLPE